MSSWQDDRGVLALVHLRFAQSSILHPQSRELSPLRIAMRCFPYWLAEALRGASGDRGTVALYVVNERAMQILRHLLNVFLRARLHA